MRRGIRYPQWWMLLVAILAILSNQGSLTGMERFAKRHRETLNELLGTHVAKPPSDSTFRLLLAQLDVGAFEALLQQWMAAQPGVTETVDTLVCDGKTLRVAITQSTDATDAGGGEIEALRQLLDRVELEGLLVQADALHANRPFSRPRAAWRRLPDRGETQSPQRVSGDQRSADLRAEGTLASQSTRTQTRSRPHLEPERHERSGVGGGELAGERHDPGGALQRRPRGRAH